MASLFLTLSRTYLNHIEIIQMKYYDELGNNKELTYLDLNQ